VSLFSSFLPLIIGLLLHLLNSCCFRNFFDVFFQSYQNPSFLHYFKIFLFYFVFPRCPWRVFFFCFLPSRSILTSSYGNCLSIWLINPYIQSEFFRAIPIVPMPCRGLRPPQFASAIKSDINFSLLLSSSNLRQTPVNPYCWQPALIINLTT
jgi:hypothetical protein